MCWDTEIVLIRISALQFFLILKHIMCWDTEVVLIRILVLQSFLYWYEYTSLIMNTQTISIYRISELSAVLCCVILCCLLSASAVLAAQALVTLRISAQNLTLFSTGAYKRFHLKISQTINLEIDSGIQCINYPIREYLNYRKCDEHYVYEKMKTTYNVIPFWAATNFEEVTNRT